MFLDANENPYNTPNNRYPDPLQKELKALIAPVKKVNPEQKPSTFSSVPFAVRRWTM